MIKRWPDTIIDLENTDSESLRRAILDHLQEREKLVQDLASVVKRLARQLPPDHPARRGSMEFLQSRGLFSPLRGAPQKEIT